MENLLKKNTGCLLCLECLMTYKATADKDSLSSGPCQHRDKSVGVKEEPVSQQSESGSVRNFETLISLSVLYEIHQFIDFCSSDKKWSNWKRNKFQSWIFPNSALKPQPKSRRSKTLNPRAKSSTKTSESADSCISKAWTSLNQIHFSEWIGKREVHG